MLTKKQIVLEPDDSGPVMVVSRESGSNFMAVRFVSTNANSKPEDRSTADNICVYVPQIVMEEFGMPNFFTVTFEPGDNLNG